MAPSRRDVLRASASTLAVALLAACGRPQESAGPQREPAATGPAPGDPAAPPAPSPTPAATTGPATELTRGSTTSGAVALTFHASGDPALVEPLLAAVESSGARITVFAVGSWLADNPQVAARALRGGHELANHTWTHPDLARLGAAALDAEIVRCRDVLSEVGGSPGAWFRPSQADSSSVAVLAAAGRAGYRHCLAWDVDPKDFRDPGAAVISKRVLEAVTPGSVVSLHFGHPGTITALPAILTGLTAKGLRAVTASELLDKPPR